MEVVVVAGKAEAERIIQALGSVGITGIVQVTAGLQEMFRVMVAQAHLVEARDIASMFQSCECQQEGNRDEPEARDQAGKRPRRRGIIE